MYVYSDIVEQSHVGNNQIPIMGFLLKLLISKKMDIGYSIRLCM